MISSDLKLDSSSGAVLKAHDWPGNIRELQNCIERAVLFSPGPVLRLPLDLKQTVTHRSESASRTLADADREHILDTLQQANWLIGGQDGAANRLAVLWSCRLGNHSPGIASPIWPEEWSQLKEAPGFRDMPDPGSRQHNAGSSNIVSDTLTSSLR